MSPESELRLSFYKDIAVIDPKRHVDLVQHIESRRIYVRKTVSLQSSELFQLLQERNYPQIPRIMELIEGDDRLIIIEQYIDGTSLQSKLAERFFTEDETRQLMIQLCQILQPLHKSEPSVIHRDIKPSNLMLDDSGRLWLIDFDAAKCFDPGKERDTVLMGTVDYAAPEQYGFSQSDHRTDIYSIGVLMNKMLTGQTPQEALYEGALKPIIQKCVSLRPQDRYTNTKKLSVALQHQFSPVSLVPPGFRQKKLKHMIPAALWYLFLISFCVTGEYMDEQGQPYTGFSLWVNRICSTAMFLLLTLYFGNYLNLREWFPFKKCRSKVGNALRLCLGAFLLALIPAFLALMLE